MAFFLLATLMVRTTESTTTVQRKFCTPETGNPYLPLWEHLPDGEHVF